MLFFAVGCQKSEPDNASQLQKVVLKLDWYAEPAHGGFYQAMLSGFYAEEGLDVEIIQGGPGAVPLQSVTVGNADFALRRVDDVILGIDRGLPLLLVMAYMQKDPQAIMFHASNPIETWQDLDGKALMVEPGSTFVTWLQKYHGIHFDILPSDYGIQRFLADKNFIQQCFITSQPYFAKQQGAEVKTLLLSDSGYNPERVVMTNRSLAKRNPEMVAAFVRASIRGWEQYMRGDPSETHQLLNELNKANNDGLNAYSHRAMLDYQIVFGDSDSGKSLACLDAKKLEGTISTLHELGLIQNKLSLDRVIDYSILPPEVAGE
ncbi:MAG: ABC transporter substrate-binding protein [Verrucomicrobiae bacterium]|nr:ABC transporter substrate-binding protein [Verrucomicrobiae bacterium]